jgi:hypothetical protein
MAQTVRRYKFATFPVLLLTLALGFYVMILSPPVYEASGSYILVSPPAPPTQQQITDDPALAKVNANNPLVAYGNLQVVGLMLSKAMSTKAIQDTLLREGVDPRSSAVNDTITSNAPLVDITGVGSTPALATQSGMREGQTLVALLNNIQARMGVSPAYRVSAYPLVGPDQATVKNSGKLRNLILVIVVGIILLFVAVSVAKAREERKHQRSPQPPAWPPSNGRSLNRKFAVTFVNSADDSQVRVSHVPARDKDADSA